MKIVWILLNGGFVRNYEGVIRSLAANGHTVVLAYQTSRNKEGLDFVRGDRLKAEFPKRVRVLQAPPPDDGPWGSMTYAIRRLRDYLRYLEPPFARATGLRARAARGMPPLLKAASDGLGSWAPTRAAVQSLLAFVERAAPPDRKAVDFLQRLAPDLVMVTPLVDPGSRQVDYVKAARMLGIPSALGVASWDNLTNKGLMRVVPDRVLVWNDAQRNEAVRLHGARPDQVVVTGAQVFDRWFEWRPPVSRADFCAKVGLPDDRPYVLYLGSSPFIAPREAEFVERWLRALRASPDPVVAGTAVMVRPHPSNYRQFLSYDLAVFGPVVLWPPFGANPFDQGYDDDYAASIWHSAAVVGINTSAMIEAGILGRPVCTIRADDFAHSQAGTLHFEHLRSVEGGLVYEHSEMGEHVRFLARALGGEPGLADRARDFVTAFVRPHGPGEAATPRVVAEIERAASVRLAAAPASGRVPRALVYPLAWVMTALWPSGGRPAWVLPVRIGIRLVVAIMLVRFRLGQAALWTTRTVRETAFATQKRVRRDGHSAWYETGQWLARTRHRVAKQAQRVFWRTGSAVKQKLRSMSAAGR